MAELVDGIGKELIEWDSLSIQRIETVLEGNNIMVNTASRRYGHGSILKERN